MAHLRGCATVLGHQLPENRPSTSNGVTISEKTEIFAFGSTLYEMVTGDEPYSGKDESEIEDLYRRNIFPDITSIGPLGPVIIRCWTSDFHHVKEVAECIEAKNDTKPSPAECTRSFFCVCLGCIRLSEYYSIKYPLILHWMELFQRIYIQ
ncbi:hypothetical protein BO71DRAFT_475276 [Aspergillus ellipticus CBS 707.79]|uniref:Protein kinase domain-containing protein n=1 Tax=Aspergillus ellipticus CBS 707.79 TaxID=1448320 RepID=A0A319DSG1_9EURO|nr:hypothetical protein BO71DRAFT_475276 [Aspergillus ellipticus CBS 707.79]